MYDFNVVYTYSNETPTDCMNDFQSLSYTFNFSIIRQFCILYWMRKVTTTGFNIYYTILINYKTTNFHMTIRRF